MVYHFRTIGGAVMKSIHCDQSEMTMTHTKCEGIAEIKPKQ